ncbi:winged helix-turn-helix transcriptional regulator [Pedobacter sp. PLR]|uniref:winged helix-turn-helix transcriptional regulator n=1 Tax=Pedobacter sp. PLR TaxID=2994465 RepID=UPI00224573A4|nr:winged helix-turn-helix transcriptional regulator [Pedobacter sp. PLR]MCX2450305.1 winged helix-turn-helix transcriptional regulator [Pedobacter sp. PLR]
MSFPINPEVNVVDDGLVKGGPILDLTQRQNEVLILLKENSKLTKRDLAKLLDINVSAAQMHIELLKVKGYITRLGGTRGQWHILK